MTSPSSNVIPMLAAFAAMVAVTPAELRERIDAVAARRVPPSNDEPSFDTDWDSALRSYARAVGF